MTVTHDHTHGGHGHYDHDHDHADHGHANHDHDHDHGHKDHGHEHGSWTKDHVFLGASHGRSESRAKLAALVTAVFMVVEISCGLVFHSMALLADGVHMATHVGALGLAAGAYWLARRNVGNARFTFGSGKFGDLAAFSSAIILGVTALVVAIESVERLISPTSVQYGDALLIACVGLCVNLVSALILKDDHHGHSHGHDHAHDHGAVDNNMRAAYIHVLADAGTSVLAIAALACGYFFGLGFLDPVSGLIGAFVIASWSYGLIRDSAMVLLDADANPKRSGAIKDMIEREMGARVADLHLWRLGPGHEGLIVSLVSPDQTSAEQIKAALRRHYPDLSHVTVEVAVCADCT
jgi:cation diffusion facilitator family transporter